MFFHNTEEKLRYLVEEGYYEPQVLAQYEFPFIKQLFQQAYAKNSASRPSSAPSSTTPAIRSKPSTASAIWNATKIGCAWWR